MVVGPVLAALFAAKSLRLPLVIALVPTVLVTSALIVVAMRTTTNEPAETRPPRKLVGELREMRALFLNGSLFAMTLPIAFNKLTFGAFQALLPIHGEAKLDLGRRGVSLLFLATGVAFAATQPVAGPLVDRIAPRSLYLILAPILVAVLAVMAFPFPREVFFAAYILYIIITSIIFVATLKLVTTTFGAGGERHGGLYGSVATLTDPFTVLGPIVFMNAYAFLGPDRSAHTFLGMAAVGVLSAALFARYTSKTKSMKSTS
jgi:Na+/melibiose symporter-like transporter